MHACAIMEPRLGAVLVCTTSDVQTLVEEHRVYGWVDVKGDKALYFCKITITHLNNTRGADSPVRCKRRWYTENIWVNQEHEAAVQRFGMLASQWDDEIMTGPGAPYISDATRQLHIHTIKEASILRAACHEAWADTTDESE